MPPTRNTVIVKAANGQSAKVLLSKPVQVLNPETGMQNIHNFVMVEDCPVNLCGRDLMSGLGIGLHRAVRMCDADVCALNDDAEPHYWYSLDLTQTGPGSVTDQLKDLLDSMTNPTADKQDPNDLHCTMYYRQDPERDGRIFQKDMLRDQSYRGILGQRRVRRSCSQPHACRTKAAPLTL